MKLQYLFIVLFTFFSLSLSAQDVTLYGKIKDENNMGVAFANIVLSLADSTVVKGTSADENGVFYLKNVASGSYIVSASYIGRITKKIKVDVKDQDVNVGSIVLIEDTEELDEVVVTYQKPKLERKVDRLVFSVGNTALAEDDIWNVLKRTPSVNIINDKIEIKGNTKIGFLINERLIPLNNEEVTSLLSGNSASNVEAIEVITNPPAKYGAEHEVLINIKMKKSLIAGYNGSIYNRFSQGVFPKHTIGTSHFIKGKKVNTSLTYSFNRNKAFRRFIDDTNFTLENGDKEKWLANQKFIDTRQKHNFSLFVDYDVNDKNKLSFSSINTFKPFHKGFRDTETVITEPTGNLKSSFVTFNGINYTSLNTSFFIDWEHKLNKNGAEVSFKSHYTFSNNEREQEVQTDFFDETASLISETDFNTDSEQSINLFSAQIDFFSPLNKHTNLSSGLRFANINSDNETNQDANIDLGTQLASTGLFLYDEQISAAYLDVNNSWEKWKFRAGLRSEYTEVKGNLKSENIKNKQSYLEFFPSFSLQHIPNEKTKLNLFYYRRITRPRYQNLNPFVTFQSINSTIEGNPNLQPSIQNYLAFNFTFLRDYAFEIFYSHKVNTYDLQVFQDNDNQFIRFISTNIGDRDRLGIDFTYSKNFTDFWYSYFLISSYNINNEFTDFETGDLFKNSQWSSFLEFNNDFTLLKDKSLFLNVSYGYQAPTIRGNYKREETSQFGITVRKKVWQNRASISVGVEDIFNKSNVAITRKFSNQDLSSLSIRENRLFTFAFRYKFGNTTIKNNTKSKRIDERSRI